MLVDNPEWWWEGRKQNNMLPQESELSVVSGDMVWTAERWFGLSDHVFTSTMSASHGIWFS
jgi:hypothetical protein